MMKLLRITVAAFAAAFAVSTYAQAKPISYRETVVGSAGAAINTTAHHTSNLSRVTIACDNSLNGSTTGTLLIEGLAANCTTIVWEFSVTCTATGTNGGYTVVQLASDQPGVTTTGLTQIPVDPPDCLKVNVAAAGSVDRAVTITGR